MSLAYAASFTDPAGRGIRLTSFAVVNIDCLYSIMELVCLYQVPMEYTAICRADKS